MYGAPLNAEEWSSLTVPTLVAYGAKSPAVLQQGSRALAEVLPNVELRELKSVSHNVKMDVLAPVLAEFFAGETDIAVPGDVKPATRLTGHLPRPGSERRRRESQTSVSRRAPG